MSHTALSWKLAFVSASRTYLYSVKDLPAHVRKKSWQADLYLEGKLFFPSLMLSEAQEAYVNWLPFRQR